mgnify:CR=1 FL=1
MNLRTFIERPILSAVISISIVVVGIIGLFTLPVEQYPDIAPPTIQVSTSYFGASAETLQKSVIAPLEEAINGVENMTYMTSTASNAGVVDITVYFKRGDRSRYGSGQCAEPCIEGNRTVAGGSNAGGCDYFQASDQYLADVFLVQSRRFV